jgi:hypothetical protein
MTSEETILTSSKVSKERATKDDSSKFVLEKYKSPGEVSDPKTNA